MESVVSPNVPATSQSVLSSFDNVQSDISTQAALRSPPLPPRSPLRPKIASKSAPVVSREMMSSRAYIVSPQSFQLIHSHTLSPLSTGDVMAKNPSLPILPMLPSHSSPVDMADADTSSTTSTLVASPTMTKRKHALFELLSSERAYASDLALIRDIHIPLALGQSSSFNGASASSRSSGSSSRTFSTTSESSSSSTPAPAMTKEDTKIIFSNISELALIADSFTGSLEEALGSVLEGGQGQDRVGALFLEMIPVLEPPYTYYITRHPMALEHLNNLPQTTSLDAYLQHTRTLASSLTHAWDLPSLLIKPVQRLLKYSLLLSAIINGTSDGHEDKENLKIAKEKMDEVARGVNEGRRRREVVKEVLTGGKREDSLTAGSSGLVTKAKKKGLNVGVAASISMGKMRGITMTPKTRDDSDGNEEKEQVDKMECELKRCESFIRKFAKDVVHWGMDVKELMTCLSRWTQSFARVIGISDDQVSESFDAFRMVIDRQILALCDDLEQVIQERLLVQLAILVDTTLSPSRLLEAMHTLEPLHYGLLNLNVSKSRPPPALLEASQSYVALRGQLFAELPKYLELLHRGIAAAILQMGAWQSQFWGDVRERWLELWEALRVDGEKNVGDVLETMRIWWDRFSIIDKGMNELEIVKKFEKSSPRRPKPLHLLSYVAVPTEPNDRLPTVPTKQNSTRMMNILAALESPGNNVDISTASPERPSQRKIARRSSDSYKKGSTRSLSRTSRSGSIDGSLGHSPRIDLFVKSKQDQLQVSPILRQSSDGRRIPASSDLVSSSSYKDNLESSPKKINARRRLTDTLTAFGTEYSSNRRTPSLPSLNRSASFGFRSSSPMPRKPRSENSRSQPPTPRPSSFVYTTPVMYECEAITTFNAGRDVKYEGIPFHKLKTGRRLGILQEAGHPCTHPNLPIHVDDGEDCLLMAMDTEGTVGWVFASFLIPVD